LFLLRTGRESLRVRPLPDLRTRACGVGNGTRTDCAAAAACRPRFRKTEGSLHLFPIYQDVRTADHSRLRSSSSDRAHANDIDATHRGTGRPHLKPEGVIMESLLATMHSEFLGHPAWMWLGFIGIVVSLLAFDLGVLHRDQREIGVTESLVLSAGYIAAAVVFGAWIWWYMGAQSGMEYYTGFMIEKSLSMDNVFVIALIFTYFAIPRQYQHRVLFWGILGVIVLRALMIGLGAALVSQFSWVLYFFGAFLVFTGVKMWIIADHQPNIADNPLLRFLRRHMRVTEGLRGNAFWVKEPDPETGRLVRHATPLFLALMIIEFVDLVFAVDSVPAIFAITTDPFIVYTSNIFAILGLRALYFALAAMIHRFRYLKYALALVLVFIGTKIFLVGIVGKIPASFSLSVTLGLIAGGVLVSLWKTRTEATASA
jgi:tellurite resistance protein TerC